MLIGCEAAYLFPTDIDVCLSYRAEEDHEFVDTDRERDETSEVRLEPRDDGVWGEEGGAEGQDGRDGDEAAASWRGGRGTTRAVNATLGAGHEIGQGEDELVVEGEAEEVAGKLVIHVRSGDIFVSPAHPAYGQVGMCQAPFWHPGTAAFPPACIV